MYSVTQPVAIVLTSAQGFDQERRRAGAALSSTGILTASRARPQEMWLEGRAVTVPLTKETWRASIDMR